jgi:hypothetical protein
MSARGGGCKQAPAMTRVLWDWRHGNLSFTESMSCSVAFSRKFIDRVVCVEVKGVYIRPLLVLDHRYYERTRLLYLRHHRQAI